MRQGQPPPWHEEDDDSTRVSHSKTTVLFSNHSAVKQEQNIFTLNIIQQRQESGKGISFIDS